MQISIIRIRQGYKDCERAFDQYISIVMIVGKFKTMNETIWSVQEEYLHLQVMFNKEYTLSNRSAQTGCNLHITTLQQKCQRKKQLAAKKEM